MGPSMHNTCEGLNSTIVTHQGHGIGSFLNVHEGPFSIGSGYNSLDPGLRENFITSNGKCYAPQLSVCKVILSVSEEVT